MKYSAFLLLAMTAHAGQIIFSDLGTGNSYIDTTGGTVSGASSNTGLFVATGDAFTPTRTFFLTQVDIALNFWEGTNAAVLTLNWDAGGVPGPALMTWDLDDLPAVQACCAVSTVVPTSPLTLLGGARYWLVASPGASNSSLVWETNDLGEFGLSAQKLGNSPFSPTTTAFLGAFDVQGTVVPEPCTIVYTVAGMVAIVWRKRRAF